MKKLIQWLKVGLSVFGLERLKKRAIKSGHCMPDESHDIDYPKSGVKVI